MSASSGTPRILELTDGSAPTCDLNIRLPRVIDERLARLVDLVAADKVGPTNKRELAAALIFAAEPGGLALWDKLLSYRRATVGDAAFWVPDDDDLVPLGRRRPSR
jgi:hypothetical protein